MILENFIKYDGQDIFSKIKKFILKPIYTFFILIIYLFNINKLKFIKLYEFIFKYILYQRYIIFVKYKIIVNKIKLLLNIFQYLKQDYYYKYKIILIKNKNV